MKKIITTSKGLSATAGIVVGIGLVIWSYTYFSDIASTDTATRVGLREGRSSDPSRQTSVFLAQAEALKEKAKKSPTGAAFDGQIRRLLADWAQSDPEAALSFALSSLRDGTNEAFFRAADAALSAWAQKEPEEARAYLENLSDNPRVIAELAPALMRTYAELSTEKAQEWVRSGFADDSGELRPVLARELVSILMEKGRGQDVEKWLADTQVAEAAYALPAVSEYSRLLAAKDVNAALAFSRKLPPGTMSRGVAIQNAVQAWASHDEGKTYAWLVGRIAGEQSRQDLFAASGKSPSIPAGYYTPDELDYAISGYVLALAPTSRKEAMESAVSIQDAALRRKIQQQVSALIPRKSS